MEKQSCSLALISGLHQSAQISTQSNNGNMVTVYHIFNSIQNNLNWLFKLVSAATYETILLTEMTKMKCQPTYQISDKLETSSPSNFYILHFCFCVKAKLGYFDHSNCKVSVKSHLLGSVCTSIKSF